MAADITKLCGESKARNKVLGPRLPFLRRALGVPTLPRLIPLSAQARRRTTTQMELLYANSDSVLDAPTADFSSPMLPLAEAADGGGEVDSSGSSVRDYAALSPGFASKMGSM